MKVIFLTKCIDLSPQKSITSHNPKGMNTPPEDFLSVSTKDKKSYEQKLKELFSKKVPYNSCS